MAKAEFNIYLSHFSGDYSVPFTWEERKEYAPGLHKFLRDRWEFPQEFDRILDHRLDGTGWSGYWDKRDEDMTALSLAYPDILFCVKIENEDSDRWEIWYWRGKHQECEEIKTFLPFDINMLKEIA